MNGWLIFLLGACLLFAGFALIKSGALRRPGRPPAPAKPKGDDFTYHYDN